MPTLTFISSFSKNSDLLFSAQEIRQSYLYGIKVNSPLSNSNTSLQFSDENIEFFIRAAQKEIENYLSIKLFKQIYAESQSFSNDDWRYWGFMKTTYQVAIPLRLEGFLNTLKQTEYPKEWLSSKRDSDGINYHKSVYIVPAGNTGAVVNSVMYAGLLPNLGYLNAGAIPNYWQISYVTGFDNVPADIMNVIGTLIAINILFIAGSNVFGIAGVTSQSLSIDGLSQALSSSSNAFGDRIKAYNEDLQRKLITLVGTYKGITFGVC